MNVLAKAIKKYDPDYLNPAKPGERICGQLKGQYCCTRELHDDRKHAAHNTRDEIVAIWEDNNK